MKRAVFLIPILIFAVSCAEVKPEKFTEDKSLFEYALKLYNDKQFEASIPFFEHLQNRFPQSPYATDSQLKVADANFERSEFQEAEVSYQTFRTLHPTHPKTPYVVFRLGLCHFERVPSSVDRDQTHTQRALDFFTELTNTWPTSLEANEAKGKIEKLKRALTKRELYIADFYLKQKDFKAALVRLKPLSESVPFNDIKMEAKYKLGFAYYRLKDKSQAKEVLSEVAKSPDAGKYQSEANSLLSKIGSM